MDKIYLDDNIFYIKNFLSEKSHAALKEISTNVSQNNQWDFSNEISNRGRYKVDDPEYSFIWHEYDNNLNKIFDSSKHYIEKVHTIEKMIPSTTIDYGLGPHSDDDGYKKFHKVQHGDPMILFGTVYYINSDYLGGELEYVNFDIKIKPIENTLVCHPGTELYEHFVNNISSGNRYSIPNFVMNKKYF